MQRSDRRAAKRAAEFPTEAAAPKRARKTASRRRQADLSPLARLPSEIVPLIFHAAHSLGHTSPLLALQRSSKACWEIVTPLLYRHVTLPTDEAYESFLHVAHKDSPGLTDKLLKSKVQEVIGDARSVEELPAQWQRSFRMWDMVETLELCCAARYELYRTTKLIFGVMKRTGRECLLEKTGTFILNCDLFRLPTRALARDRYLTFSNSWGTSKYVNPRLMCVYDAHRIDPSGFYTVQNATMSMPAIERVSIHGAPLEKIGQLSTFGVINDFYVPAPFRMATAEEGKHIRSGLERRVSLRKEKNFGLEDYRTTWNILRCPRPGEMVDETEAEAMADSYRRVFADALQGVVDRTDLDAYWAADPDKTKPLQAELDQGSCWNYKKAGPDDVCQACYGAQAVLSMSGC